MVHRTAKPLVLIIDDDPRIREGLSRRLRSEDFAIATAESGAEALPLLKSRAVAVVLCDEALPGQSGISILKAIREVSPHTVRMMLTGAPCVSLALRAINAAGVYHFFTKPCDTQELALTIREAIKFYEESVKKAGPVKQTAESHGRTYELPDPMETTTEES